ncbi:MAG TPA: hypothetical protein VGM30_14850 [Puia sp.]|jgi:hypothetical protein
MVLSGSLFLPGKVKTDYIEKDMISSKYILNILDLLLDGDEKGKALRCQIDYLTDIEYDYTGVGLYVSFKPSDGIEKYRYQEEKIILDGVSITSTELGIGASATIFVRDGIIKTLEIWSYDGEYPRKELNNYKLKQEGTFGAGREISINSDN